jgi:hypothetical protein
MPIVRRNDHWGICLGQHDDCPIVAGFCEGCEDSKVLSLKPKPDASSKGSIQSHVGGISTLTKSQSTEPLS